MHVLKHRGNFHLYQLNVKTVELKHHSEVTIRNIFEWIGALNVNHNEVGYISGLIVVAERCCLNTFSNTIYSVDSHFIACCSTREISDTYAIFVSLYLTN